MARCRGGSRRRGAGISGHGTRPGRGAELVPEQRCGTGLSAGHGSRTSSAGEKDAMALADAGLGDEFTPARDMAGRRLVRGDGAWRGGDRGDELEEVLGRLGGSAGDACNEEEGARAPASINEARSGTPVRNPWRPAHRVLPVRENREVEGVRGRRTRGGREGRGGATGPA